MVARGTALVLLVGLLACFAYVWPFSVDDSYILAQYARRLATGQGYTFREGPPSDGVTGPLWLVPLVAAVRLGVDAAIASKVLGGLSALAAALLVLRALARRALFRRSGPVAAMFMLSSVPFVTWSVAGLETAFAALLALIVALSVLARPGPRALPAALASAGIVWLRPELVPFVLTLLLYLLSRRMRQGLWVLATVAVAALAVVAFRTTMFGEPWPMVASAKPPVLGHGANYVFAAAARASGLWLLLSLSWGLARARVAERVLAAALVVHAAAVMLAGGDWMPGMRLFAPVVPVTALFLALMLSRRSVRATRAAAVVCGLLLSLRGLEMVQEAHEARRGGLELTRTARELAEAVAGVPGVVVALDVGALAYRSGANVVDLGGLTEPRIARAPGGHLDKRVDSDWLATLRPGCIVLHSRVRPRVDEQGRLRWFAGYPVEQRVLAMEWVRASYRVERVIEHASDYFYVLLVPRDAPFS